MLYLRECKNYLQSNAIHRLCGTMCLASCNQHIHTASKKSEKQKKQLKQEHHTMWCSKIFLYRHINKGMIIRVFNKEV